MADRLTPAEFSFEDFRVQYNNLATDVGDISTLNTDIKANTVTDITEAVNELIAIINQSPTFMSESIIFEGSSNDAHQTTLSVINPTADRTVNIPDADGEIILDTHTQTLYNKTFINPILSDLEFDNPLLTSDLKFKYATGTLDFGADHYSVDDDVVQSISSLSGKFTVMVKGEELTSADVYYDGINVNVITVSNDVDDQDTDTKLCIYVDGGQLVVKNRLGSTKEIAVYKLST